MRVKRNNKKLTRMQREEVGRLEEQLDQIIDQLLLQPSDTSLYRSLRELEIKIVALTGEQTIDY